MIDSADYSPDGKFLVIQASYRGAEPKKVPVTLLDELIERGLSSYELQQLLFVRRKTAGVVTRKVCMEDLVGEDLTGKTVGIYFRNYEDSEWMETSEAIGVQKDEEDGNYCFVFPPNYETCFNGDCSHYANEDNEDAVEEECFSDSLQGHYFWGQGTVLVQENGSN